MKICEDININHLLSFPSETKNIVFSLSELSDFASLTAPVVSAALKAGVPVARICFVPDIPSDRTFSSSVPVRGASEECARNAGSEPDSTPVSGPVREASAVFPDRGKDRSGISQSSGHVLEASAVCPDGSEYESGISSEQNPECPGKIREIRIALNHRFLHFTVAVQEAVLSREEHTVFLFDCLSLLQTAWATDLMMVNFFKVITPVLRQRNCAAFFPLMALMHSDSAREKISQCADIFLDVCSDFKYIYTRALKAGSEDRPELFQPHIFLPESGLFEPVTDGVRLSRYHRAQDMTGRMQPDRSVDSWDRFFLKVRRKFEFGEDLTEDCARMCQIMMSRDLRMRALIRDNFRPEDYFFVKEHMVGSGQIGGKACGMLTARKIIENRQPDLYYYMEAHDSFYIGSDVFASYIVENDLWEYEVRQRSEEEYFSAAKDLKEGILHGSFWEEIREQFVRLLEYYGQAPIIVRSSSVLEDGFDNAFAGKYESVFCPNTGTLKERLKSFEDAVRTVYASTMSLSALDYRKRRGLDRRDEQMAILVMRVSGSHLGNYFMPDAAGVGYSTSPYRFLPSIDLNAGMLRLVMGLGTAAVDRTEGAYPRLVSLDCPEASPYQTSSQRHRYSQRKIGLIDKASCSLRYASLDELYGELPGWRKRMLLEHDSDAERMFRERGDYRSIEFISCRGLTAKRELMEMMRRMMRQLQDSYGQSVDIEFTVNLSEDGDFVVNLLQCRPLQVLGSRPGKISGRAEDQTGDSGETVSGRQEPAADGRVTRLAAGAGETFSGTRDPSAEDGYTVPEEGAGDFGSTRHRADETEQRGRIFLQTKDSSMGIPRDIAVDGIVLIDPVAYYEMPYREKPAIARLLGQLNWHFRELGKNLVLLSPGRIGTSSPELGVPTAFSDISSFNAICELSESRAGYQPELSYGSHIFQDLVEADILYIAVFEDERRVHFHPEYLKSMPNRIGEILKQAPAGSESVIGFYDVSSAHCRLIHDMEKDETMIVLDEPAGHRF